MATRFGLVQTASIIGVAVGGLVTKAYGPFAAYGVLGVGLVLLAMYAIAAGRNTTNPLHGAAYEEATKRRAVRITGSRPQNGEYEPAPKPAPDGEPEKAAPIPQAKS